MAYQQHFPRRAIAIAVVALLSFGAAHAQIAPNAGQILRDLQAAPLALPPSVTLPQAQSAPDEGAATQAKVLIKSINISGNQEIPTPELAGLVSDAIGTEQTLNQLNAAARRITAYYRSRGYAVARAILPAQDITAGSVTISVIEGRVSASRINNTSRLPDAMVSSYLGSVKPGDTIRSSAVDRGMLLLQDTPGVAASRATLQPGASVGTSELLIEVTPSALASGSATLDNYGSRYTGQYRLGLNAALASPLSLGDQLSASALTAGGGLSFGRLALQLPVGSDGLRLGLAYFATRYKLGREFAALDAQGSASSTSIFAGYPFIRSPTSNLSAVLSFESKNLSDQINSTATTTDKQVSVTSLGLTGNAQDGFMGGGINSFDVTLVMGKLNIKSAAAAALDAAGANTNGSYSRAAWGTSRLQSINPSTQLAVTLSGQQAGKNLDSSEKFSLGGISGVRAYPQGEASGDEGLKATLELRHNFHTAGSANWQITAFYDAGTVKTNKNPFGAAGISNSRSLSGVGFGLNAAFDKIQLKAALAWRTSGGAPASLPQGAARSPVLLVAATVGF